MILSTHSSGIAKTAVSFSGLIFNSEESNRTYLSDKASSFFIANFECGSLFHDKY